MKILYLFVFMPVLTFLGAQQLQAPQQLVAQGQHQSTVQSDNTNGYKNATITYKIIDRQNNTFGYDVFVNGKLTIHQTSIPAMPGNEGFKTKGDASNVASLVMDKIKKGEMPPTITTNELKKLNVIK